MRVGLGKKRRFSRRNTSLPGRKFPLKKRIIFIPLLILAGFFYAEHRCALPFVRSPSQGGTDRNAIH